MDRKFPESGPANPGPAWIDYFVGDEKRNNGNEFILSKSTKMITFGIIFYFYVCGRFVRPKDAMP